MSISGLPPGSPNSPNGPIPKGSTSKQGPIYVNFPSSAQRISTSSSQTVKKTNNAALERFQALCNTRGAGLRRPEELETLRGKREIVSNSLNNIKSSEDEDEDEDDYVDAADIERLANMSNQQRPRPEESDSDLNTTLEAIENQLKGLETDAKESLRAKNEVNKDAKTKNDEALQPPDLNSALAAMEQKLKALTNKHNSTSTIQNKVASLEAMIEKIKTQIQSLTSATYAEIKRAPTPSGPRPIEPTYTNLSPQQSSPQATNKNAPPTSTPVKQPEDEETYVDMNTVRIRYVLGPADPNLASRATAVAYATLNLNTTPTTPTTPDSDYGSDDNEDDIYEDPRAVVRPDPDPTPPPPIPLTPPSEKPPVRPSKNK